MQLNKFKTNMVQPTLGLLPGRSPDAPPLKPFYDPARRHDRSVDYDSMRRL